MKSVPEPLTLCLVNTLPAHLDPTSEHREIDLWSDSDRSILNLVPTKISEKISLAREAKPELFERDERELRKEVLPTPTDNRLRLAFWNEYNRAQSESNAMKMNAVYAGVCSAQYFHDSYLQRPEHVAWLLCPPAAYQTIMEEALMFGIDQLRDILEMSVVAKNGQINVKLGELKAKIVAMLDLRVKGAVMTKNVNLNLNAEGNVKKAVESNSMEDVDRRIAELEMLARSNERDNERAARPVRGQETVIEAEVVLPE